MFELPWTVGEEPSSQQARAGGTRRPLSALVASLRRAVRPRRGAVDARVLVLGTVGTGTVTERLGAVLERRGVAVRTVSVEDGDPPRRNREAVETLVVEGAGDADAVRAARDLLGPPDVVVVTALGRDGTTARGPGHGDVIRSVVSSVPAGAQVVNAEGSPALRRALARAVDRRGASIVHVGGHEAAAPGAELGSAIDGALAAIEEPPLPDEEREALATASRPQWLELPGGRLYDALGVTDAVAIERLRRALTDPGEPVELVVALPRERSDVAPLLADYAGDCHDRRALATVHALGPRADRFAERCSAPTIAHGPEANPAAVLRDALSGAPALVVGVAGTPDGEALEGAITARMERSGAPRIG